METVLKIVGAGIVVEWAVVTVARTQFKASYEESVFYAAGAACIFILAVAIGAFIRSKLRHQ